MLLRGYKTMAQLAQVWTVCVWTAVTFHILHALETQYPTLNNIYALNCECKDNTCNAVLWFRKCLYDTKDTMEFLFYYNNADRTIYNNKNLINAFKGHRKDGPKITYILKITNVTEEDTGLYFCLLQYHSRTESGGNGVDLRPGKRPPTPPPIFTKKAKKPCHCKNRKTLPKECSRHILWSLVGVLLSLVAVLLSTLYYFNRLPKKCRHRFAKKQQL